jgi:long-chain fatty acid transport protein
MGLSFFLRSLVLLVASNIILANPLEERFELGARMKAMGGIGVTQAEDFSATYYNPANLGFCPSTIISLGYQHTATSFKSSDEKKLPEQLGSNNVMLIGACLKLPLNIAFGAYGSFGVGPVALKFRTADGQLRMPLYDNSLTPPTAGFAVSIRPIKWLALGVGTSITIHTQFEQKIILPLPPAKEALEIDMGGSVSPAVPIVAGITIEPLDGLRVAAVIRSARYNKFSDISLANLKVFGKEVEVKQLLEGSFGFSPMQIGGGISYSFLDFNVGGDLTWYRWSAYRGPFLHIRSADNTELGKFINYPPNEDYKFSDLLIPRIGAEYVWNNSISARLGYGYRGSPAPEPEGVTQLVDGGVHMLSGGGGYKHAWEKVSIIADAYFSAHIMPKRAFKKYNLAGWAYNTGLSLSLAY